VKVKETNTTQSSFLERLQQRDTMSLVNNRSNPVVFATATAAVSLGAIALLRALVVSSPPASSRVPVHRSWLPYLGHGPSFFASPFLFMMELKRKYKDSCWITFFGKPCMIIFRPEDFKNLLSKGEKAVSFLKANNDMVGFAFPQEDTKDFPTKELEQKIAYARGTGLSGAPIFMHAIRKEKMLSWLKPIRTMLEQQFMSLEETGTVDLFDWCKHLICSVTLGVLLGDRVLEDKNLMSTFLDIYYDGDPEFAFKGPMKAAEALFEVGIFGERKVFQRQRDLTYPYVEEEMRRVVAGEPQPEDGNVLSSMVHYWYNRLDKNEDSLKAAKRRICNDLFMFTFAALSNSYAAAAWVMYHILNNTNQTGDNIKAELERVHESMEQDVPEFDSSGLEKIILEITRLYSPGAFIREIRKPWTMPSTKEVLQPGTMVLLSGGVMFRNPEFFENPLEFDPSRFGPERDEEKKNASVFAGFGTGSVSQIDW
jgi:cytochrome P450